MDSGQGGERRVDHDEGENNVADGFTKHVEMRKMDAYMKARAVVLKSGRHELSLFWETGEV